LTSIPRYTALGLFLAAALACGGSDASGSKESEPRVAITAADREAAAQRFGTVCFTCHGKTGGGDGPASVGLVPQPRNFQDAEWQKSVTDQHIERIIVGGGIAVGKAVAMPSNPDLAGKPGVVAALREHIRSLKKDSN
jgi:mono/diheme cytochrome c family protein